jgi:hypothetical protein
MTKTTKFKKNYPKPFFDVEKLLGVCTPMSGLLFLIGFAWTFTPDMEKWSLFFYLLSLGVGLVFVVCSEWTNLVQKNFFNVSVIILVVALWIIYIGEYRLAAGFLLSFSLAKFFWSRKKSNSRNVK